MVRLVWVGAKSSQAISGSGQLSLLSLTLIKLTNKTGLQSVSRRVEQVHYFGGWVEGGKSL